MFSFIKKLLFAFQHICHILRQASGIYVRFNATQQSPKVVKFRSYVSHSLHWVFHVTMSFQVIPIALVNGEVSEALHEFL